MRMVHFKWSVQQQENQTEIAHASSTIDFLFEEAKTELVQNDQEKYQMSWISSQNRSFCFLAENVEG